MKSTWLPTPFSSFPFPSRASPCAVTFQLDSIRIRTFNMHWAAVLANLAALTRRATSVQGTARLA